MFSVAALRASGAMAAALVLSGVCDPVEVVLQPEVEEAFAFESGLQGWSPAGTDLSDPPVDWEVAVTQEEAFEGSRSVRLRLDNRNDAGKIWIQRPFDLAANQDYDVTVSYGFGTSDHGQVNLWRIIAGVHLDPPETAAHLTFQGETGHGQGGEEGLVWVEKSFNLQARTGADARLWVAVGIWGTWETERSYFVDELRVSFTRRE